jgi:hypothetical protein
MDVCVEVVKVIVGNRPIGTEFPLGEGIVSLLFSFIVVRCSFTFCKGFALALIASNIKQLLA